MRCAAIASALMPDQVARAARHSAPRRPRSSWSRRHAAWNSIQPIWFWRGVQSPATGCTWLSMRPGVTDAALRVDDRRCAVEVEIGGLADGADALVGARRWCRRRGSGWRDRRSAAGRYCGSTSLSPAAACPFGSTDIRSFLLQVLRIGARPRLPPGWLSRSSADPVQQVEQRRLLCRRQRREQLAARPPRCGRAVRACSACRYRSA